MADFDLTQTDAQVQSILNDAQDAQGAGAQTTLTTDYIMLKDTSGNYHKILKDSFTEACRNVLAGLLVNNDKGTTISQIPAIASGDFGSVTPTNLASVLGKTLRITSGTLLLSKNTPVTLSCRNKMVILGSNMAYFNGILPMIFSYGTTFIYLSEVYKSQFENNMTISYSDSILTLTGKLDNDFGIPYIMLL